MVAESSPTETHSPTEQTVIRVWGELLGTRPGSVDDDFFDLGGQSLDLVRFLQEVWRVYQVELDLTELFATDFTVTETARAIDRARAATVAGS